jgi:hypothetical protein
MNEIYFMSTLPSPKGERNKEASSKITAQMRTIYVTAQSAPTAGAAESADSP